MALHINTNLQTTLVTKLTNPDFFHVGDNLDPNYGFKLDALQKIVEGYIEVVTLKKPLIVENVAYKFMVINEEGKLSGKKFNAIATRLAKLDGSIAADDVIVGEALLLQEGELS